MEEKEKRRKGIKEEKENEKVNETDTIKKIE